MTKLTEESIAVSNVASRQDLHYRRGVCFSARDNHLGGGGGGLDEAFSICAFFFFELEADQFARTSSYLGQDQSGTVAQRAETTVRELTLI